MSQAFHFIFCVVFFVFNGCTVINAQKGTFCTTPNNETAKCISIYKCETLVSSLYNLTPSKQKFIQESQCGVDSDNNRPLVCCGYKGDYDEINFQSLIFNTLPIEYKAKQLLPEVGVCGAQGVGDRVFYGEETGIDEYPWMALLGYRHNYGGFVDFSCGGVLISSRYVLTAAHCVKNWELYKVRLGEHNRDTEKDCVIVNDNEDCNEPAVDYLIEEIIVHPDYFFNKTSNFNDIALIRLQEAVNFTYFIVPICLPFNISKSDTGSKLWVAGWGLTENNTYSSVKRKADLTVADKELCKDKYKNFNITIMDDTHICALGEQGKDSCKGDSGGPLMKSTTVSDEIWYVVGIVSFGPRLCGTDVPGVYTDVKPYIRWILETMEI